MRLRAAVGAVVVGAVTLVGVSAGPASAGCSDVPPLPDGRIREVGGSYEGDGLIDCDPVAENSIDTELPHNTSLKFEARFRNEEDATQGVRLTRGGITEPEFKVKFKRGQNDITDKILAGKVFPGIAPDQSTPKITIKVKALDI